MVARYLAIAGLASMVAGAEVELSSHLRFRGVKATSRISKVPDVDQYLGIPFANPPVGSLRFAAPEPFNGTWEGVRSFEKPGKGCFTGKEGTMEDCLYLNVYRPSNLGPDERLPVMVWIYGGGFTAGSTTLYNGTELAARNRVIIVVPAYRLGMLGFYKGNWGILDQQLALKWVRDNISAFSGDKTRVTLFGQSAGAFSVATHLVSPGSRDLFSAAILSSPTSDSSYFFQDAVDADRFSDWAATTLAECDDMTCMRSVPVSRFVISDGHRDVKAPQWASRLFPSMPWGVRIDGDLISDTPLRMAQAGHVANVPVIIGITQDEGTAFTMMLSRLVRPQFRGDIPADLIKNITEHVIGDEKLAQEIMKEYALHEAQFASPDGASVDANSAMPPKETLISQFQSIITKDISTLTKTEFDAAVPALAVAPPARKLPAYNKAPLSFFKETLRNSLFACPLMEFADAISKHNGGRVWAYNFALDVWADTPWYLASMGALVPGTGNMTLADLGAFHGAEIPFIWNLFPDRDTVPSDLGSPLTMFNAFTGRNFCPADSFKRTVADRVGCIWTSLAKCGSPGCDLGRCGPGAEWRPFGPSKEYLNIQDRGEMTMKTIPSTGRQALDAFMPSVQQCEVWKGVRLPFHNFVGAQVPKPVNAHSGAVSPSAILAAFLALTALV